MPVVARRRPLLDDRRPGGLGSLLGRSSVRLDRTASEGRAPWLPTQALQKTHCSPDPKPTQSRRRL